MKHNNIHTSFNDYLSVQQLFENKDVEKYILDKKQLFVDGVLVSESGFNIEKPDKWFNEKYVTIFDLKTIDEYQGKGYAKYLLNQIFDYVKNILEINIITLLVYKDNYKAISLYTKRGFKVFIEYDDSFTLIKKLN